MSPKFSHKPRLASEPVPDHHIEQMLDALGQLDVGRYAEILSFQPTKVGENYTCFDITIPFHKGPVYIRKYENLFHIGIWGGSLTYFAQIYFDVSPLVLVTDLARFKLDELIRRSEKLAPPKPQKRKTTKPSPAPLV